MFKSIISLVTVLTLTYFSITPVFAQAEDIGRMETLPSFKEGDLTCKVICTFSPNADELYYVKIDSKYYATPLKDEGISPAIPVRGGRSFNLYKKTINEEGTEIHVPVIEAALTGSGSDYLVILSQLENKPMTSRVYGLGAISLGANQVHLFNFSPVALGIQVEEDKYVAQVNERISHNFKAAGRNSYTSATVVMRYQGENKIMGSKRIRLIPGRRVIFVCFASTKRAKMGSTPLGMVTIQDMP
ncbi:MAG: hypothetical protein ACSHX6_11345 [Akkermansiaceae bacterium]